MKQYLELLNKVLTEGEIRSDRTGTGTLSLFGPQLRFDLSKGFPIMTTKRVSFRSVVVELLWFLQGDTNVKYLRDNGCTIWDEWADSQGNLGPVYGAQWRDWNQSLLEKAGGCAGETYGQHSVDQIKNLVEGLDKDPFGRRHIVTAWNPSDLLDQKLPPCHCFFQMYVHADKRLSCHLYQRSADIFLGVPFNITSYALLTAMIAKHLGLNVGELVMSFGDCHLYSNHVNQAKQQLTREPKVLPTLGMPVMKTIFNQDPSAFSIYGYDPHPTIKAPVAV